MARLRGVTAAGILVIGALVTSACGSDSASGAVGGAGTDSATDSATTSPAETTEPAESNEPTEPAGDETTADAGASELPSSGKGVTIVPADAFEGGLTLQDEGLSVTDDDSGRQLFTFKSVGKDLYQVKGTDSSGENDPLCWRAPNPDEISPSAIVAGECDAAKETQHFTIVKSGEDWVISREGSGNIIVGSTGLEYDDTKSTKFRINV